jgi:hypothetical protein
MAYEAVDTPAKFGKLRQFRLVRHLRGKLRFDLFIMVKRRFDLFEPGKEAGKGRLVRFGNHAKFNDRAPDGVELF